VERDSQYQLEPEFLVIVLLALVQNGSITLSLAGKKLDAANLGQAGKTPLEDVRRCRGAGIDLHLLKPCGPEELRRALDWRLAAQPTL
jgi:hypothetical protein